jgi:hypothetical protein
MANLPAAVQAQIDEADRIAQMINGNEPNSVVPEATVPLESESVADLVNEEIPVQQDVLVDQVPQEPQPEVQPQADPKASKRKGKSTSDSEETWEQRYRSLNGMYTAEVPRLHAQIKELTSQVQLLMKELEEARKPRTETKPVSPITEEDREAFGPDLVDLIERAAESKVSDFRVREQSLVAELEALKGRLGEVTEKQVISDRDRFLNGLAALSPNWEALNVDQGFLAWLQEVDPIYGFPRQMALNAAYEALDSNRVAQIFNTYAGWQTPVTQQRSNQELQRQVAPSTSRASSAPVEGSNAKIFSQQEVEQFYNDWRRGYIGGDEAARIEREIHAAAAEGRIR